MPAAGLVEAGRLKFSNQLFLFGCWLAFVHRRFTGELQVFPGAEARELEVCFNLSVFETLFDFLFEHDQFVLHSRINVPL